jgi:uncharacterized protein
MRIEQTVEVDAPIDQVWALVNDIPKVAACMPGAALTKVVDEKTYEGTVRVKLGPILMNYKGTVILESVEDATHTVKLSANGKDVRGGGTARASVDTVLEAVSDTHTKMSVASDLQLTGKVASFGRGAVSDVSAKLFGQFADCLRATLEAGPAPATGAAEAAAPSEAAAPAEPSAEGTQAPPAPTPAPAPPPRAPEPLRAGSLAGTVVRGRFQAWWKALVAFFRRLFTRS